MLLVVTQVLPCNNYVTTLALIHSVHVHICIIGHQFYGQLSTQMYDVCGSLPVNIVSILLTTSVCGCGCGGGGGGVRSSLP